MRDRTGERPPLPRKAWRASVLAGGLALIAVVWLFEHFHPLPPRAITIACGPEGSAYLFFGKRYQKLLAKHGITVNLVQTAGGVDNLTRLKDDRSPVQAGFVISGIGDETDTEDLLSLGTVAVEPLWFFTRGFTAERGPFSLRGKRVAIGPEGSDARALLVQLLKRNKMDLKAFTALDLSPAASATALIRGQIDAAVMVNSWGSWVVRRLVQQPGIRLASITRADAYTAIFPSLSQVVIPAGVANLEKDIPKQDTTLLATKTSLIVRGNLHPALQYLLLETMTQVHSRHGILQKAGEYPAPDADEFPLSPAARGYYKSGKPFLLRYLPFWLAVMLEQTVLLLLPLIGLMYPLIKSGRTLYDWTMRRKIFLIYGELHWLEAELDKLGPAPAPDRLQAKMKQLEERTARVRVAATYMPMLFDLKGNVALVRARVDRQGRG